MCDIVALFQSLPIDLQHEVISYVPAVSERERRNVAKEIDKMNNMYHKKHSLYIPGISEEEDTFDTDFDEFRKNYMANYISQKVMHRTPNPVASDSDSDSDSDEEDEGDEGDMEYWFPETFTGSSSDEDNMEYWY